MFYQFIWKNMCQISYDWKYEMYVCTEHEKNLKWISKINTRKLENAVRPAQVKCKGLTPDWKVATSSWVSNAKSTKIN